MMKSIVLFLLLASSSGALGQTHTNLVAVGEWSAPVSDNGYTLRGRLILAEDAPYNGTRTAVVYLELQNLSRILASVLVDYSERALDCEVVDAAGKTPPPTPTEADIIGPLPDAITTLTLPCDSTLRFRVSVNGWGIPKGPGWAIQLPAAFWFLPPSAPGDRFLSGTFTVPKSNSTDIEAMRKELARGHVWHGTLVLPRVKVPPATTRKSEIDKGLMDQILDVITECQTIKPGMTRADLMKVFTTEGGMSTAAHRTFVHRRCPYIKVDVDFTPSDPKQNVLEERPTDTITKISNPYLAWSIID
ncbi:MAG TPA: hypothetical protein VMP11_09685 [Verrucomicrobiae bacterium]|nr:hypothetical protein [Verrucomicrobiae bacterium]